MKSQGQGPRSLRKCAGAKGGTIFLGDFLLHFCDFWKNDPFSSVASSMKKSSIERARACSKMKIRA